MTRPDHRFRRALAGVFAAFLLFAWFVQPAAAKEHRLHGQGRLFKVTAAGVTPSYVFGTMHSTDPDVLKLPAPVAHAFAASGRLILEMVFTPDVETRMSEAMRLKGGRTLAKIVGPEIYGKLVKRAAVYGLPAQQMNGLQPWAASMIFSVPVAELNREAAGKLALDRALQQQANARGIPVYGLESLKEQIATFSDSSERDQIDNLRLTLDLNPEIDSAFAEMKKTYLAGDLSALHSMVKSMFSAKDAHLERQFDKDFIEKRNKRMANRLARYIKHGGAFVAIGALHLSGKDGVLHLLEIRGYTVTRAD